MLFDSVGTNASGLDAANCRPDVENDRSVE